MQDTSESISSIAKISGLICFTLIILHPQDIFVHAVTVASKLVLQAKHLSALLCILNACLTFNPYPANVEKMVST